MEKELLTTLIASTYTIHKLNKRIALLKQYFNTKLYSNTAPDMKSLTTHTEDVEWLQALPSPLLNQITSTNVKQCFDFLSESVKKMQPLILYVPVELSSQEVERLGQYFRTNYGEQFVFDLKLDPSLIGGCAIVWKGAYTDLSIKEQINQNKEQLLHDFKSYLQK